MGGLLILYVLAFEKKRLNTVSIVGRSIRLPIVLILGTHFSDSFQITKTMIQDIYY